MKVSNYLFFFIFFCGIFSTGTSANELKDTFSKLRNSKLDIIESTSLFSKAIKSNVDIAESALILEREIDSKIDIKKHLGQIEKMANDVKAMTGNNTDPRHRINSLRIYLFSTFGMTYDFSDPFAEKRSNRTLSGILETKKGSCVTMPLLYLVLAQRLKYPIYPVLLPQHLFLKYSDIPIAEYNLEVTSDGDIFKSNEFYKGQDYNLTQKGIDSGSYFKTLTHKEFVSHLFSDSAQFFFFKKNDYEKGFKYIQAAITLRSKTANLYLIKAGMFDHLRKLAQSAGNREWEWQHYNNAKHLADKQGI